ncbi:putative membrane protein [Lewinella aquimaris]|uniref:Putative membrane protein n=1 Tax=Neolewinella aquimaris TaxID=1835722 RepID=A0A840E3U0_9BACT|nr:c-type cytochrome domain-containing protein [Neolewinella aquimaris]MBB4077747.1 putative membrane protein [Neolewinella aquimaris]
MPSLLLTDYALFFGRFHPLIVHLPIGFLLLAVLLELWPGDRVRPAIRVAWVLGAASAVGAATAGWLLASGGGYGGPTLFWHRWAGVAVAVLAVGGCYVQNRGGITAKVYGLMTAGALTLAGHQGGNLTHGEEYLFQYAPPVVQKLAGHVPDTAVLQDWSAVNIDSINVYRTFLRPVIGDKCVRCHNADKQNGGLRMDSAHLLYAGGDSGPLFVPGKAMDSRWVNRVTLPSSNVKAMPPQGERMTFTEVKLLEYWINHGADTLSTLVVSDIPDDLKALLLRDYALDLRPRQYVETVQGSAIDEQTREGLRSLNWLISDLVPGGPALEAKPQPGKTVDAKALRELSAAAGKQVAYLYLDGQALSDDDLAIVADFPNLNRLRLTGTGVGEQTLDGLKRLEHLESLNLYGTEVGDFTFEYLSSYPALRRVYLWQTAVTPGAAAAFAEKHPQIAVDTGYSITPSNLTK